jgi:hypothetical protein
MLRDADPILSEVAVHSVIEVVAWDTADIVVDTVEDTEDVDEVDSAVDLDHISVVDSVVAVVDVVVTEEVDEDIQKEKMNMNIMRMNIRKMENMNILLERENLIEEVEDVELDEDVVVVVVNVM